MKPEKLRVWLLGAWGRLRERVSDAERRRGLLGSLSRPVRLRSALGNTCTCSLAMQTITIKVLSLIADLSTPCQSVPLGGAELTDHPALYA